LVSTKLPGIRLVPVEPEIGWQATTVGAQRGHQFLAPRLARNAEFPRALDMDVDLVALLELERLDHDSRNANRETVAPFGDLRGDPQAFDIRIH